MINQPLSPNVPLSPLSELKNRLKNSYWRTEAGKKWLVFLSACFLVSIPVFFQAPLVRFYPLLSLGLTAVWVVSGMTLINRPKTQIIGDMILGFSWSWLAGSIYWGWFRTEPLIHLPIEAIGLPFAIWGLTKGWGKVGNLFYLGSLFGTAMTDVYFYLVHLIPYWREIMQVEPQMAGTIFQNAIAQMQTFWGITWAFIIINILLWVGLAALQSSKYSWWAFSGAVLSTILVDGLFWLVASFA
ncbi:DUF3120 domain-containing protein [Aphanothece hegewaldii CCALA 016]|uniref:DUF3120 domain-containing protein n=1 Tax=Aphanothece hegewaldii CCALA 016 TaxID=2107694 RepID=A0A2T1LRZ3_9CHRO|nr:DUF3120 domain-containing protein [Aphanothece hegewaldii]PSF32008.1 DUF3120 domain-containing protein [Aphanothece hegewaldii CCALA 016]